MSEDQAPVIAFLSRPETFGQTQPPRRCETHASIVFIAADTAYKLKRAVRYPYLDFSTVERRRAFCEAEVRINRRTAAGIYRGVVAITREAGGGLALAGTGEPVDWLVEMARFDDDALFATLAAHGRLERHLLEDLADRIAAFHAEAERRPAAGGSTACAAMIENNAQSFAGGDLDTGSVRRLLERWLAALATLGPLLDRRRDEGYVRHCHGDLHLGNIVLFEARATLFDAIEFNDAFADIDTLYDLAFLLMDLGYRGLDEAASVVFDRYLDNTGEGGGLALLALFVSLRAGIRAHVDAAAARAHSDPDEARRLGLAARRYLERAHDAFRPVPPRLVAIGGLSGSGKSRLVRTLAPHLHSAPGARVLRTDSIRKRLAGVPLDARLGPEGYAREMTGRTYRTVCDEAGAVLAAGRSAIADAVFASADERAAIRAVAARAGVPFTGLWLDAPAAMRETRVGQRRRDVSDADADVVRIQLGYEIGGLDWARVDSSGPASATLAAARSHIDAVSAP